ncbi:hypothetical protein [Rhodococcus rhodnii]|uniref:hypothetical protein n=1 Tax=Rhodococcus rhodnii TaxID=38312 RepID=UPI00093427EE|nr:hypothetical protein [Rhodococcus rhodnii]
MLTTDTAHEIDFSSALIRGARRNPMISVIIDGGAQDDTIYGHGFAHLREHWALASLHRMYGDHLVMCSAKTLQYQTELLLFTDSEVAPLGTIDWWQWSEADLAHEVARIGEEIVAAESDAVGCAFDRQLPQRLEAYSTGADWGYGDRDLLGEWTVDSLAAAVHRTWGRQPAIFSTTTPEAAQWRPSMNEEGRSNDMTGLETVPTGADHTYRVDSEASRAAYCGWLFRYDDWRSSADLDDLTMLMRIAVNEKLTRDMTHYRWEIRVSQFGERYVTRGTEYLGIGIFADREVRTGDYRNLAQRLLEHVHQILLTEIQFANTGLMAAVDRYQSFRRARLNQALPQRAIVHTRAKVHGNPDHPDLRMSNRTAAENHLLMKRLSQLVEQMLVTDPEIAPVRAEQR